jgi:hypothetical protein
MPTLDRYLKDIRAHLPGDQADDIINELGENLRAQIDDRQEALGRDLSAGEVDEILKAHGNPLVVASRYRKEQLSFTFGRQLIGPALFPAYLQVLTINIAITAVLVLIAAVLVASGQPIGSTMSSVALAILIQFGVVTGIFVAADRMVTGDSSFGFSEVAAALPSSDRSMLDRIAESLIGKQVGATVPHRTSATDLAVSALFVGWLVAIRPPQEIGFLRSGPGWETYYLPLILVVALAGIQPVITLVRPAWTRLRSMARIAADLAILGLFVASLRIGEWVVLAAPDGAGAGERTAVVEINRWIGLSLTIAAAIALAQLLLEVRRVLVNRRAGGSMATAAV